MEIRFSQTSSDFSASVSFIPKKELKSYEEIRAAFEEKMNETATKTIATELIRIAIASPNVPNLNIFAMCTELSAKL